MSKRKQGRIWKIIVVTSLFALVLTGARYLWLSAFQSSDLRHAVRGQLDLRDWDADEGRTVTLDGNWEFYPYLLLDGKRELSHEHDFQYIPVPGGWNESLKAGSSHPYGYGSYRLQILVNPERDYTYSLRIPSVRSSSALYVNGRLLAKSGQPAAEKSDYVAWNLPYSASFGANDNGVIEVIIQAANFTDPNKSGIVRSVKFGTERAIARETQLSIGMQLTAAAVFMMHAGYALILFLSGARDRRLLYFSLLAVSATLLHLIASEEKLLPYWLPIGYELGYKLVFLSEVGVTYALFHCVAHHLPAFWRRCAPGYSVVCVVAALLPLLLSAQNLMKFQLLYVALLLASVVSAVVSLIRATLTGTKYNLWLLLSLTAFTSHLVWWGILVATGMKVVYYPFDLIASMACFASVWFRNYILMHTETRQLAAKLQQADKHKDAFLANTSHELRNPLHGILNISQAVLNRERNQLDKQSVKELETVLYTGRRMSYMLNDLLDAARLKESTIRLQFRSFTLQAIIPGVLDMLRSMIAGKPVRIFNRIPERFPPVYADENRVIQIVFNLLHNAVKYTNEGVVTIRGEVKDGKAHISIADTGIGMDAATLRRVFEPYERAFPDQTMVGEGFGLGLSISKQLVELHGELLQARSVPGQGSEMAFTLRLADPDAAGEETGAAVSSPALDEISTAPNAAAVEPYAAEEGTEAEVEVGAGVKAEVEVEVKAKTGAETLAVVGTDPGRPVTGTDSAATPPLPSEASAVAAELSSGSNLERLPFRSADRPAILAVDDDPLNLQVLDSILSLEEYDLQTTTGGEQALQLLESREWDLVISDVMMPRISGFELTRTIRKRFTVTELPVLLLTAGSQAEDMEKGFLSGANDYVTKPVDAMELRARVKALTEMKHSVRERLRMEAAWLQAQIQPHFLFNTLNAVAALSEIDTKRMRDLLEAFGIFLRTKYKFPNLEGLVPVDEELTIVRSYLHIEQERFRDRLQVTWDIGECKGLTLPLLTIQPLVENALRHGIMKRSRGGHIHIRLTDYGDRAEIEVKDDGVGMDAETVRRILAYPSGEWTGIGLPNTDRRLKRHYGRGLQIRSNPGQGTSVSFVVGKSV